MNEIAQLQKENERLNAIITALLNQIGSMQLINTNLQQRIGSGVLPVPNASQGIGSGYLHGANASQGIGSGDVHGTNLSEGIGSGFLPGTNASQGIGSVVLPGTNAIGEIGNSELKSNLSTESSKSLILPSKDEVSKKPGIRSRLRELMKNEIPKNSKRKAFRNASNILWFLFTNDHGSRAEMQKAANMSKGGFAKHYVKLKNRNLVKRISQHNYALTDQGREMVAKAFYGSGQ